MTEAERDRAEAEWGLSAVQQAIRWVLVNMLRSFTRQPQVQRYDPALADYATRLADRAHAELIERADDSPTGRDPEPER